MVISGIYKRIQLSYILMQTHLIAIELQLKVYGIVNRYTMEHSNRWNGSKMIAILSLSSGI